MKQKIKKNCIYFENGNCLLTENKPDCDKCSFYKVKYEDKIVKIGNNYYFIDEQNQQRGPYQSFNLAKIALKHYTYLELM